MKVVSEFFFILVLKMAPGHHAKHVPCSGSGHMLSMRHAVDLHPSHGVLSDRDRGTVTSQSIHDVFALIFITPSLAMVRDGRGDREEGTTREGTENLACRPSAESVCGE